MTDILSEIRAAMGELRHSERKVAEFVVRDPDAVIRKSITDLAEESDTSEPTVIRFCRKLGLKGYMDLKLRLARDMPSRRYIHESVSDGDTLPRILVKMFNSAKEAFTETLREMDPVLLEKAASALSSAKRIEFYGLGGSATVAMDAQHKFFRLGQPCIAYSDPHMQIMSAALLSEGDVVVVISYTGSTKDVIESAKVARGKGATVIGILGKGKSPLSKVCHVAIPVHSQEAAMRLAPMTSRLVQLAIIDVLFVTVAMRNFDRITDRLDMVKEALVDKRY